MVNLDKMYENRNAFYHFPIPNRWDSFSYQSNLIFVQHLLHPIANPSAYSENSTQRSVSNSRNRQTSSENPIVDLQIRKQGIYERSIRLHKFEEYRESLNVEY